MSSIQHHRDTAESAPQYRLYIQGYAQKPSILMELDIAINSTHLCHAFSSKVEKCADVIFELSLIENNHFISSPNKGAPNLSFCWDF